MTCVDYGQQVLRHPLVVEAITDHFVPVVVFNNIKGDDETALRSFNEPAWNNPVVRVVDSNRQMLAPRVGEDYTVSGIARAMTAALQATRKPIPPYLELLAEEHAARRSGLERATFAMHCFWEGEAALGKLRGVISSRPGFVGNEEVVDVLFDPSRLDYSKLVEKAQELKCASSVYTTRADQLAAARRIVGDRARSLDADVRADREPKYYLAQTPLRFVPMSETQATRINAALAPIDGRISVKRGLPLLSPRQRALLTEIGKYPDRKWPVAIGAADLTTAWQTAMDVARE